MLSKISLEERSYIIGLFQGDGNLSKSTRNRGKLSYEISKRDADIIYKLEKLFSNHVNITISERCRSTNFKDDFDCICLTIFNMKFREELNKFLPYGKKSLLIKPQLTLSDKDYIRGLIDSDGSLGRTSNKRCFISLCTASKYIKEFLIDSIFKITGREKVINRNKRDNIYNITLFDEDAKLYAEYLYKDSQLYIDRKYEAYKNIMLWERPIGQKRIFKKTWLPEEDRFIKNDEFSIQEKMKLLGRSEKSICMRLHRLRKL